MSERGIAKSLWYLLRDGEFDALKSTCPDKFCWGDHDSHGYTPLQRLVELSMPQACGGRAIDAAKIRDIASWLMQRGADPHQQASKTAPKRVTWDIENSDDADDKEHDADDEKDKTGTAMPVRSHTAISSLICLRYSMRASDERKDHDDDDDDDDDDDYDSWTEELTALDQLLQVFISGAAQAIQNEKVTVDVRVIDFWDEMRRDDSKHDVMLDTADGPVGAHQMVLTRASSMLAAMLSSGMREGQEQRIPCEDTTANATGLLLDLLYTGSTTQDVTLDILPRPGDRTYGARLLYLCLHVFIVSSCFTEVLYVYQSGVTQ